MAMLINGRPDERIAAADRGLSYGDGVFRTLELLSGRPRLWAWQYARLCDDARRLRLPPPEEALLLAELAVAGHGLPRAAAKIVLTRGAARAATRCRRRHCAPASSAPRPGTAIRRSAPNRA